MRTQDDLFNEIGTLDRDITYLMPLKWHLSLPNPRDGLVVDFVCRTRLGFHHPLVYATRTPAVEGARIFCRFAGHCRETVHLSSLPDARYKRRFQDTELKATSYRGRSSKSQLFETRLSILVDTPFAVTAVTFACLTQCHCHG